MWVEGEGGEVRSKDHCLGATEDQTCFTADEHTLTSEKILVTHCDRLIIFSALLLSAQLKVTISTGISVPKTQSAS